MNTATLRCVGDLAWLGARQATVTFARSHAIVVASKKKNVMVAGSATKPNALSTIYLSDSVVIADAKIRALREALERDGEVKFKNGSVVTWSATQAGPEGEQTEGRVEVERPAGGRSRYLDDDAGLRRAYEMALNGPKPKPQPSGDPAMFGDAPPF